MELLPQKELDELKKDVSAGEIPIWEYWDEFVECYLEIGRSDVTVLRVRDTFRFLMRNIRFLTLEDFNRSRPLRKILMELKRCRSWSPVTYNTYLKNINTYFIWLEKEGLIEVNNVRKVTRCVEPEKEQRTLTQQEVDKLLVQTINRRQTRLQRLRNIFIIQLFINFGLRNCELLQMKVADLKSDAGGLKIIIHGRKQKGGPRYYKMYEGLRDACVTYMNYRKEIGRDKEPSLLISTKHGYAFTKSGLRKLFERLSKELGFQVSPYPIRRYVATKLYLAGYSLQEIADYFGHKNTKITLRYIQSSCLRTDDCARFMAGLGYNEN